MEINKIWAIVMIQLVILLPIEMASVIASPNIENAQIINIKDNEATVNFTTTEPAKSTVYIGIDANLGMMGGTEYNYLTSHSIILSNLQPNKDYYYKIIAQNESLTETNLTGTPFKTFATNEIKNVTLNGLNEEPIDSVTITWQTAADAGSTLYYGNSSDNLDRLIEDATATKQHSVVLSGLTKGQTYYYKVKSSYVESSGLPFTVPMDINAPVISYTTKPAEYTTNNTAIIKGTIDENATIEIRSNVIPVTIKESGSTSYRTQPGAFQITIELPEGKNIIEFSAKDDYNNIYTDYFNVSVDSTIPKIELINFTNFAPFPQYNLTVRTSEDAKIEIKLDGTSIGSTTDYVTDFNKSFAITRNNGTIEITAEDKAGNKATRTENITKLAEPTLQITKPNLSSNVVTRSGNRYKMDIGMRSIRIEGKTTPGAKVYIWKSLIDPATTPNTLTASSINIGCCLQNQSAYTATPDANGHFTQDVQLVSVLTRADYEQNTEYWRNRGGGTYEQAQLAFDSTPDVTTFLHIQAIDQYGRKNVDPIDMEVKAAKCSDGSDWDVAITPDAHNFKPYRLKDGTEILTVKTGLTWIRFGEGARIRSVNIEPQTKTLDMTEEEKYACFIKGDIFPRAPSQRISDPVNGTYWFFKYKLNKWSGLNNSVQDDWHEAFKNLLNKKCDLPLKVVIDYEYTSINGSTAQGRQVFCFEQKNLIEEQLDPRNVFPPDLLETGINLINASLNVLKVVDEVLKVTYIAAKALCTINALRYYAYYIFIAKTTCLTAKKSTGGDTKNWDLEDAKPCAEKIDKLKKYYNRYRFYCDRIFCKNTPYNPGNEDQIEGEVLKVQSGPKNGKCKEDPNYACVKDVTLRKYYCGDDHPNHYETADCPAKRISDREDQICCRKVQQGIEQRINLIKKGSTTYNTGEWSIMYEGVDPGKQYFVKEGGTDDKGASWNYGLWYGFGGETPEQIFGNGGTYLGLQGSALASIQSKSFKAHAKGTSEVDSKIVIDAKANNINLINTDIGTMKPQYETYIGGIYGTSCFGQQRSKTSSDLYLEPTQNILDAIKCGCVSQIYAKEQMLKGILERLQSCMMEVKVTGQASAGACKQLFTQFVCDLLTWAVVKAGLFFTNMFSATYGTQQVEEVGYGSALSTAMSSAVGMFQDDYGAQSTLGSKLSLEYLTHTACMLSFNNQWGEAIQTAFGGDVEAPPTQSAASIIPATREMMGTNPIDGTGTFEYNLGIWFSAGSNIKQVKVELICDEDGDCPGHPESEIFRTEQGTKLQTGLLRDIAKNNFIDEGGRMIVDNKAYRYNKARVTWVSKQGTEFSGSEEVQIDGSTDDYRLFDCSITPTAGLGGNDLLDCGIFRAGTSVQFIRPPQQEITVAATGPNQAVNIPFTIRATYASPEDAALPLLLLMKETDSNYVPINSKPPQQIQEGTTTESNYDTFYTGSSFGSGEATISVERVGTSHCTSSFLKGPVPQPGNILIIFPDVENFQGTESKTSVADSGVYDLSTTTCDGVTSCCKPPKCSYNEQKKLVLKIGDSTVTFEPEKKAECRVVVSVAGAASNQQTKYYLITVNENIGGNVAGTIKYEAGAPLEYKIKVNVISSSTGTTKPATPEAPGAETAYITVDREEIQPWKMTTGQPFNKNIIVKALTSSTKTTTIKDINISLENQNGRTVLSKELSVSETVPINIEGTYFPEQGPYKLRILVSGEETDPQGNNPTPVKKTQNFDITVEGNSMKPPKPTNFYGSYNTNTQEITLTWNKAEPGKVDGYKIKHTPTSTPDLIYTTPIPATANPNDVGHSLIIKNTLTQNTTVRFIITSYKDSFESDEQETLVTVEAKKDVLPAPTNFIGVYDSINEIINLSWDPIPGTNNIIIQSPTSIPAWGSTRKEFSSSQAQQNHIIINNIKPEGLTYSFTMTYTQAGQTSPASTVDVSAVSKGGTTPTP